MPIEALRTLGMIGGVTMTDFAQDCEQDRETGADMRDPGDVAVLARAIECAAVHSLETFDQC